MTAGAEKWAVDLRDRLTVVAPPDRHPELVIARRAVALAPDKLRALQDEAMRLKAFVDRGELPKPDAVDSLCEIARCNGLYANYQSVDIEHVIGEGLAGHEALGKATFAGAGDGHKFNFDPPPYVAPDPTAIPPRQWLLGRHYLCGAVSATIGGPGRLKSSTVLVEIIGMACGRDLLAGTALTAGPLRAAYINGEETQDELDRRVAAICQHYHLDPQSYAGRLWVVSTRDKPIRVAVSNPKGNAAVVDRAVVDSLISWCDRRALDVVAFDPLISFHSVRESSNEDMDVVVKAAFGAVAGTTRSVDLEHHPRKLAPGEVNSTVDDARGASALLAAVRVARTFNFMTTGEATQLGIHEDERRKHVRVENGKSNPGPIGKANWLKITVENLPNGDEVACATPWQPPNPFDGLSTGDVKVAQGAARSGVYRADSQSPKWLGWWLAENLPHLGIKARSDDRPRDKAAIARLNSILKTWVNNDVLQIEERPDETRHSRRYYIPGNNHEATAPGADDTDDVG
jgi:hypothetical protein